MLRPYNPNLEQRPAMNTNVLYWGDNLPILRNKDNFPDESVDLVYLDPPFNKEDMVFV